MKKLSLLLALLPLALGFVAAQTPTPTPGSVYRNSTASHPAREADARAVIAQAASPEAVADATLWLDLLTLQDATPATWANGPSALAAQIIAAKGAVAPGMSAEQAAKLYAIAVPTVGRCTTQTPEALLAFITPYKTALSPSDPWIVQNAVISVYADSSLKVAANLLKAKNYDAAVAASADPVVIGKKPWEAILLTTKIKTAARADDALSWAKLAYLVAPFDQTPAAIETVAAAFRSVDLTLDRGNAFIAAQKDAAAPNLLADVPLPAAYQHGGLPTPDFAYVNLVIQGQGTAALNAALSDYALATDNNSLHRAAAVVSQVKRDIAFNLIDANAFAAAQSATPSPSPAASPMP